MEDLAKSLRGGSALLFGGFMLGNVVAYAYQMILSRTLSPADYGALVTLTSAFYVIAVFWRAVQAWVIDAVAGVGGTPAKSAHIVFASAIRGVLPLGVVVLVVHWLGSEPAAIFLKLDSTTPVLVLGLYVSSAFLLPIAVGLPLGLNRPYLASAALFLESAARLGVGLVLVLLGFGVGGALGGYVAGNFAAFGITVVVLWPLLSRGSDSRSPRRHYALFDRYAVLALAVNASLMIIASVDQIAVKHYFSDDVAGNYAVAFLLGRIIAMSTLSLAWVIFARSANMAPDDPRRTGLLIKGLLATGALALSLTAAYLVAPSLAVLVLGGANYALASNYVGLVGIEMTLFSFVYVQAYYHISVRKMQVAWPLGLATALEISLLAQYHATIHQVLWVLILVMGGLLIWVSLLTWRMLHTTTSPIAMATAQTT